ncbi:hypothetical protein LDENG_00075540, partial [Lucifuga dentata]
SLFKVLLLTSKILHGLAPLYLRNFITPYVPPLRLQEGGLIVIPSTNTKFLENRAFSCHTPLHWNKLSAALKEADSIEMFKFQLKTHLFLSSIVYSVFLSCLLE